MCRALRRPQMAPQKNCAGDAYAGRLDGLKQALKPYRDNHVNRLRAVTRSARVNLNKRWKSLENLFAAAADGDRDHSERAENAVNELLEEDRENADPTSDAVQELRRLHVVDR